MKLCFRKFCLLLVQISLILLLNLPLCGSAKATDITAQQAEADAVITSFAMDACKAELPASEFALWPIPLQDSAVYSLRSRPSADWSSEVRQFVLAQFQRHTTDLKNRSYPEGQVNTWLQLPDPLKDTTLRFDLQPAVSIQTQAQAFDATVNVDVYNDAKEAEHLSQFLSSLSTTQKAKLMAAHGWLPLSDLTEQQKVAVRQVLYNRQDFGTVNGEPIRPFDQKDTIVMISVIVKAVVQSSLPGTRAEDYYATTLARPLNPLALPGHYP